MLSLGRSAVKTTGCAERTTKKNRGKEGNPNPLKFF
jgi:hypothetical protein